MTREEYKMIQKLLNKFCTGPFDYKRDKLIHDIKSEIGLLYSTKLGYQNHCDISGYRYEDLLRVAKLLNEKHIQPQQLTSYMDYFQCGFDYCNKLQNKAFNKILQDIIHREEGAANDSV